MPTKPPELSPIEKAQAALDSIRAKKIANARERVKLDMRAAELARDEHEALSTLDAARRKAAAVERTEIIRSRTGAEPHLGDRDRVRLSL